MIDSKTTVSILVHHYFTNTKIKCTALPWFRFYPYFTVMQTYNFTARGQTYPRTRIIDRIV